MRTRELTPIEEASRLNQKLKANYEARLARLTPGQAYQKTSLVCDQMAVCVCVCVFQTDLVARGSNQTIYLSWASGPAEMCRTLFTIYDHYCTLQQ